MSENGNIYARLINELGETTTWATGNVSKIDRTKPNINVTTGSITSSSIVVNVSASDTPSGLATTNAYRYYLNGTLMPVATGRSYNFTGLSASTKYTIKVIVYDQAGNTNEQTITPTTGTPTVAESKGGSIFNTTTTIKDSSGNSVKVPGGFKIASDSANNVSDGVVVEDANGNQFVWIPVNSSEEFRTRDWGFNPSFLSYYGRSDTLPTGVSDQKQNVVTAGGFYMGRFCLGNSGRIQSEKRSSTCEVCCN